MKARWWHAAEKGVVCELCPRLCSLAEGQRGFCFVRKNVAGSLVLTTYGKSTGFCIDPIEKKPLNHFFPGTATLSFGTAGCNLGCKFCQNWDISKARKTERLSEDAQPDRIVAAAEVSGCHSIAFTYNDPITWAEYVMDTARVAHAAGLKTVAVTAGSIRAGARAEFFEHIDAANVDLKAFTEDFYRKWTLSELAPVLDTLQWLKRETDVWLEVTNLLIPGLNDGAQEIRELSGWILEHLGAEVPLHFSAFHPDYQLTEIQRTPHSTLLRAREIARALGLRYVYVGNVHDVQNQSTYCPDCDALLMERDHFQLGQFRLENGSCPNCHQRIAGRFDVHPGNWGYQRVGISLEKLNLEENAVTNENSGAPAPGRVDAVVAELQELPVALAMNFTREQLGQILQQSRALVHAALGDRRAELSLAKELAQKPCYGVFVSLKRGRRLRSCIGAWGTSPVRTLGALLVQSSVAAATKDQRFPSILVRELPLLSLTVSIMHSPRLLAGAGAAITSQLEAGKHGVVLQHPSGARAVLLPQVATENGWSIEQFLARLSQKAGLTPDAWQEPGVELLCFECVVGGQRAAEAEFDSSQLQPQIFQQIAALANGAESQRSIPPELTAAFPGVVGLQVENSQGATALGLQQDASLVDLLQGSRRALEQKGTEQELGKISRITLLTQQLPLLPQDYPSRHQTMVDQAILAEGGGRRAVLVPGPKVPPDKIQAALQLIQRTPQDWADGQARLTAWNAFSISLDVPNSRPPAASRRKIRPAAVAGTFYPAAAAELEQKLDSFFTSQTPVAEPERVRALMLPHAGWRFCGDIIVDTLSGKQLSDTVIVVGPKHTRPGPNWSVSAAEQWQLPNGPVAINAKLCRQLSALVPGLVCESEAHREEHGVEVLLPFLKRLHPQIQVVPLAIGFTDYAGVQQLSAGLKQILSRDAHPPLFIISSDLNHYAEESRNRELDQLALDAMCSGSAEKLYQVCKNNNISMCGLLPAVAVMNAIDSAGAAEKPRVVGYANSARVNANTSRVVGYAGVVLP